jgi:hypothetical protein
MITFFLDSLNQYSNLIIATLTIFVIYFAYKSLQTNMVAIRTNTLPILFPKISVDKNDCLLTLENYSNFAAYDVDIWIIGEYFENDTPVMSLLSEDGKKKVKIDFSKSLFNRLDGTLDDRAYGIADRIYHYAFPPKTKCRIHLDFMVAPETAKLIIQFRDTMGHNYIYQSWFFFETEEKNLKLGSHKVNFQPSKRLEFPTFSTEGDVWGVFDSAKFRPMLIRPIHFIFLTWQFFIQKIRFSILLEKGVKDIFLRTFSRKFQKKHGGFFIEDRGEFFELKD